MHTYYTNPNDDDFCQILREERNKGETHQQRTFVFTHVSFIQFFVFGFLSLLATKLRKYENIM